MLVSSYNSLLVLLSIVVAILASYTALDLAGRITSTQGRKANWWLLGGACAMGTGIWSMHFIGMLAFDLPIPLGYDPIITLFSLLIAIVSSAFALWLVCQKILPWPRLAGGALLLGAGIASMHYTGMAALHMTPSIRYIPSLFALSIAIAILASGAALWLAFRLRRHSSTVRSLRVAGAVVMGFSIVGMHYTGMMAAEFPIGSICGAARDGVSAGWLALVIIIITLAVITLTLTISILDLRLQVRTTALATSLEAANQELTYLALHDSLTKLPNRTLLDDRLNRAIQGASHTQGCFAMLFMDLDGFKAINDVYGYPIGDKLLVEIAQRLRLSVGPQDTVARLDGDEFVLLISITEPADAATLAEKVLTSMRSAFNIAGHELRLSSSIGITIYPEDGKKKQKLMANADTAMYHAKNMGRNTYCFFKPSMNVNVHEQLQLIQGLRLALERNEFVLHYQSKFAAPDGPLVGVEALVRWEHPSRGLLEPDHFIPLAEKNGIIVPIGYWILDKACEQIRLWHDADHMVPNVTVNLLTLQFNHPDLISCVQTTLERHALAPQYLTLEITKSTAMHNAEDSLRILHQLQDMGVHISIEDFGTDYDSLMYLK